MPKYVFECQECCLRFERTLKMANHLTHTCPNTECGVEAPRLLDGEAFAFAFAKGGAAPANSGVHQHDYPTADRCIGADADERWEYVEARNKAKAKAREVGRTNALMRETEKDGSVEYRPMTQNGIGARRRLADAAIQRLRGGRAAGSR